MLLTSEPTFAQGSIDPTFAPLILKTTQAGTFGAYATRAMVKQSDGKIVVGGNYHVVDNQQASRLRRLNADGSPDAAFATQTGTGPDATGSVVALALQSSGKILAACTLTRTYNGSLTGNLVRLNATGSVDATFNAGGTGFTVTGPDPSTPNFSNSLRSLAVQPDDKVVVGGNIDYYNGQAVPNLLRLNADGSYDASFNMGSLGLTAAATTTTPNSGTPEAILVQPDGKIVVGGSFAQANGVTVNNLVRFNADGSRDNTFLSTGTNATVRALAIQPDGKLLVGGYFTQMNGQASGSLVRLNADGSRDASFAGGTLSPATSTTASTSGIYKIRPQADGSLMVSGTFTAYNGTARGGIAKVSAAGTLDTGFGPAAATTSTSTPNIVYDLLEMASGQVLVGGTFTSIGGAARTGLARFNNTVTQADATYNPLIEFGAIVYNATPISNGDIILDVNGTSINGTPIASPGNPQRLNASGAYVGPVVLNFSPYTLQSYSWYPQPDGRLYVVGQPPRPIGTTAVTLLRVLASGALDTSFTPVNFAYPASVNASSSIGITVLPSGGLFLTGDFTSVNSQARPGLARVSATGAIDAAFNPVSAPWQTAGAFSHSVAGVQPNGQPLLSWYDATRTNLVRLSATTGALDNTFSIGSGASGPDSYFSVGMQPNGQAIVSGDFSSFNGQAVSNGVLRLLPNGQPDASFVAAVPLVLQLVQPDGRIIGAEPDLRSNNYYVAPLLRFHRLNANGSLDPTFPTIEVPQGVTSYGGYNVSLTLQPQDGKLLAIGAFTSVNGQLRAYLARFNNTLLATRPAFASAPALDLFPNPAQQQVTLRLPAGAAPATAQPVTLLDVQGRAVRRFTLPARQTEITLPLADVAPGVYVLQTTTAAGPARQRVVVAQ